MKIMAYLKEHTDSLKMNIIYKQKKLYVYNKQYDIVSKKNQSTIVLLGARYVYRYVYNNFLIFIFCAWLYSFLCGEY